MESIDKKNTCIDLFYKYGKNEKAYKSTFPEVLFKVKKTQIEMFKDRGYQLLDKNDTDNTVLVGETITDGNMEIENDIFNYSLIDFIDYYSKLTDKLSELSEEKVAFEKSLDRFYICQNGDIVRACYSNIVTQENRIKDTSLVEIKSILEDIIVKKVYQKCVFIVPSGITNQAKTEIERIKKDTIFTFFNYNELIFNITKHILQPKFEILNDEEISEELTESGLHLNQLARISILDPIVRYYDVSVGTVFRIIRKTRLGSYVTYRVVSPTPLSLEKTQMIVTTESTD
jgi:DNA-directed RNA polymerase subunit H (RpoH/RPB5)